MLTLKSLSRQEIPVDTEHRLMDKVEPPLRMYTNLLPFCTITVFLQVGSNAPFVCIGLRLGSIIFKTFTLHHDPSDSVDYVAACSLRYVRFYNMKNAARVKEKEKESVLWMLVVKAKL